VNFVVAVLLFAVFYIVVRLLLCLFRRMLRNPVLRISDDVTNLIVTAINAFLWIQLAPIIVGQLGIPMDPFISVITVVIFCVGISLMPAVENFVAGVMLLWLTPFKIGDVVHLAGGSITGTVISITTSFTGVRQPDGTHAYIPNSAVYNKPIHNHTQEGRARIAALLPLPEHTCAQGLVKARRVMLAAIEKEEIVLQEPVPVMVVRALSEMHLVVEARVWVRPSDYYTAEKRLLEVVRQAFVLNDVAMSQRRLTLPDLRGKEQGDDDDDEIDVLYAIAGAALVATGH